MSAILFGSISTIADTSELQRAAFNQAFAQHGLDWNWDRDDYIARLEQNGGAQRIADYAASRNEQVDADAVHQTKSEIFQKSMAGSGITARPGVVETVQAAKDAGFKVGLVTTTASANISALLDALSIQKSDFDVVVDVTSVDTPKPDSAAYDYALRTLGEDTSACVAIEDNLGGVHSAVAAGLQCVAFPNQNTAGSTFDEAAATVQELDFEQLRAMTAGA